MNASAFHFHDEPHRSGGTGKLLNWLRAAVLGANDGIVSVSALVVGVAGASDSAAFILTAGIAGLLAGALSMAIGEYVSVAAQRDSERALLVKERHELKTEPEAELQELTGLYEAKGLSRTTAEAVARELTARDVLGAHAEIELHMDPKNLVNPISAATASAISFVVGASVPLLAIILAPALLRVPVTFAAVIIALMITGVLSAWAGGAKGMRATARIVIGGVIAMAITFGVGKLFGVAA